MSTAPFERVVKAAVDRGASDIHIKAGDLFRARIDGQLVPLTRQRLTPAQTRSIALRLLPSEEARAGIDRFLEYDCSWGLAGVGRFRVSLLRQRSSFMIVLRVIPFAVPTLEELGLPEVVAELAERRSGLLLVTGGPGSGASSTIAAMVHHLNQAAARHVITVEEPIEFLHRDLKSSVTQREVGIDTESALAAIRAAVRHDPDVIVTGQLRDADTLIAAIEAAEGGTLVIGALPAADAAGALGQAIATLPLGDRDVGRVRLAEVLRGVVAQRMVPRKDHGGLVAAVEVLIATPAVQQCLRDPARLADLPAVLEREAGRSGIQTFAQHLAQLARDGVIAPAVAELAGARTERSGSGRGRR